jgi:hypothetical protein
MATKKRQPKRLTPGRPREFATPEALLEGALEYFAWADENPWVKNEALKKPYQRPVIVRGKETKRMEWVYMVKVPTQRPYSLAGFGTYHAVSQQFILDLEKRMVEQEKSGRDEKARAEATEFLRVIAYVRTAIASQQWEGASTGAFNANIIARTLGLTDKKDITTDGESLNKGYYDFVKARRTKKEEGGNHE